jgi:hypothetical protein
MAVKVILRMLVVMHLYHWSNKAPERFVTDSLALSLVQRQDIRRELFAQLMGLMAAA